MSRINPWLAPNLDAPPPRHPRGMWLNYRKLASSAYVPSRRDRMKLLGGRPHGIAIDWSLAPQQTLEFQGVCPGYGGMMQMVASSAQPEGFQVLLYDPNRKRQFTEQPIENPNMFGTASRPFFFKKLYPLEPKTPLLARVTNLSTLDNYGQIVVYVGIIDGQANFGEPVPGPGMDPVSTDYSLVSKPPWIERPAAGEPFNPAEAIVIPAIGSTSTIIEFRVPIGRSGVIKWLGNEFEGGGWINGDGNLIWQLLVNGAAVKNHERIVMSLGTVQNPRETATIRLRENDLVKFTVLNNPNGPTGGIPPAGQLVLATLSGWFYPKELDPANLW